MSFHLYTNKNPHVPSSQLNSTAARLARGAKDVLQNGLRFGKAVVLVPHHLKQQIFGGGCRRWIDPSRKAQRNQVQSKAEKIAELTKTLQGIEQARLDALAKAAGQIGEPANPAFLMAAANLSRLAHDAFEVGSASDRKALAARARLGWRLLKNAHDIEAVDRMPRTLAVAAPPSAISAADVEALKEAVVGTTAREAAVVDEDRVAMYSANFDRVTLALDAYVSGTQGCVTREEVTEEEFHAITEGVLKAMVAQGTCDEAHLRSFQNHRAQRLEVAKKRPDAFKLELPPALAEHPLVRANVGKAWYRAQLVVPEFDVEPGEDKFGPGDIAPEALFTQENIAAWYLTPNKTAQA